MNYANSLLSELAINFPMITEVFRKNRLDFCCGGRQTLKDACDKKQINVSSIISEIEKLQREDKNEFQEKPLDEITRHIVNRYHNDLRRRLPELIVLSTKVEKVHCDHESCPTGLSELLNDFNNEMQMHMMKEENVLFPLIESGRGSMAHMPVKVMMMEHDSHGFQLEKIHELTCDFIPPSDACATWRALYSGLAKLEQELMDHIHLENNILFPRALTHSKK